MFTHRSASKVNANISSTTKTHLIRGAIYLLLFLAVFVMPVAVGQRQSELRPQDGQNPTGFVCYECSWPGGWQPGPDMPSTAVRTVGVLFTDGFYVVGGRSADGVGNDLPHPFKYDVGTNTWSIKSATYPDNQVSDMACGVLTDS